MFTMNFFPGLSTHQLSAPLCTNRKRNVAVASQQQFSLELSNLSLNILWKRNTASSHHFFLFADSWYLVLNNTN